MILAASVRPPCPCTSATRACESGAAEQGFEEFAGIPLERKTLFGGRSARAAELESGAPVGRGPELLARSRATAQLVVRRPFLRVPQNLVGLADFLEADLGVLLLADIGMVFARELAISLLDLLGRRVTRHTHDGVVVLELHPFAPVGENRSVACLPKQLIDRPI